MLFMDRRIGQCIMIGDVKVIVLAAGDGRARLGFEASEEIIIDRAEIRASKLQDRELAKEGEKCE